MSIFRKKKVLVFLGIILAGIIVLNIRSAPLRAPNLILITIETLRADRLGSYGYRDASTPHIDTLAGKGMRFTSAVTSFPRTTPALATLLTGLRPLRHGSREVGVAIKENLPTLAKILKDNGYTTIGISGSAAAGPYQKLEQGFSLFDMQSLMRAENLTKLALSKLGSALNTQPLFLWIHYFDPHFPYSPPPDWKAQPKAAKCRKLQHRPRGMDNNWWLGNIFSNWNDQASAALEDCSSLYDAEIAYTDHHVGKLLDQLRTRGILDNSVVVLTSDHGENLGESNLFYDHGPNIHDASLKIPLIIAGNGIRQGLSDQLIAMEDIMPTLLPLLKVPETRRPRMSGIDFSSCVAKGQDCTANREYAAAESGTALQSNYFRTVVSGYRYGLRCINSQRYSLCKESDDFRLINPHKDKNYETDLSAQLPEIKSRLLLPWKAWEKIEARERSVRSNRFKIVEYPQLQGGYKRILYDLHNDPAEAVDVSNKFPEIFLKMRTVLTAFTAMTDNSAEPLDFRDDDIEILKTLGYLQ